MSSELRKFSFSRFPILHHAFKFSLLSCMTLSLLARVIRLAPHWQRGRATDPWTTSRACSAAGWCEMKLRHGRAHVHHASDRESAVRVEVHVQGATDLAAVNLSWLWKVDLPKLEALFPAVSHTRLDQKRTEWRTRFGP